MKATPPTSSTTHPPTHPDDNPHPLQLCRAFLMATLTSYHPPTPSLSLIPSPPTYPPTLFSSLDAATEIWRAISTYALPALKSITSSISSSSSSSLPPHVLEDMRWLKALCMDFGQ